MDKKSRLRIALVIVLIAIIVGVVVLPYLFDWRATKAYARIKQGDMETTVILYLGYPDIKGACGTQLQWDKYSLWHTLTPGSACERSTTSWPPMVSSILRSYSIMR